MSAQDRLEPALMQTAKYLIKAYVGIAATVRVPEPGTIEHSQGQARHRRRPKS